RGAIGERLPGVVLAAGHPQRRAEHRRELLTADPDRVGEQHEPRAKRLLAQERRVVRLAGLVPKRGGADQQQYLQDEEEPDREREIERQEVADGDDEGV